MGVSEWIKCVVLCERNTECQRVIETRQNFGQLAAGRVLPLVETITAEDLPPHIDVVMGGFPCQDISAAGKQAGVETGTRTVSKRRPCRLNSWSFLSYAVPVPC